MRFAITLTVDASASGRSLHDWLVYMLLDETPDSVLAAIKDGRVAVDGLAITDPDARIPPGAEVRFQEAKTD